METNRQQGVSPTKLMATYGKSSRKRHYTSAFSETSVQTPSVNSLGRNAHSTSNLNRLPVESTTSVREAASFSPGNTTVNRSIRTEALESRPTLHPESAIKQRELGVQVKRELPRVKGENLNVVPQPERLPPTRLSRHSATGSRTQPAVVTAHQSPREVSKTADLYSFPDELNDETNGLGTQAANLRLSNGLRRVAHAPFTPTSPLRKPRPTATGLIEHPASEPKSSLQRPRVRVIDALVEQAQGDFEYSIESDGPEAAHREPESSKATMPREKETAVEPRKRQCVHPGASRTSKTTYSSQRSMLREKPAVGGSRDQGETWPTTPLPVQLASEKTSNLDFTFPDEEISDDDTNAKGAIQSIHELRQAGANNRLADEMDDLFERIGEPSELNPSMRRHALLEMATKMQQKNFMQQFTAHGMESSLLAKIGQEEDIICGFTIISTLLRLLSVSTVPHFVRQLHDRGIGKLLNRLLTHSEDIKTFASPRQGNMSRRAQTSLLRLTKDTLALPTWKSCHPRTLSARTLALKFLEVFCRPSGMVDCAVTFDGLTSSLFSILEVCLSPGYWADGAQPNKCDCLLAASTLEAHSIRAMESDLAARWTSEHLPSVAKVLGAVLRQPIASYGAFEHTVLKLALNTTNNNPSAALAFSTGSLFPDFVSAIVESFTRVELQAKHGRLDDDAFDRLILMLGVMINFCEHCPSVRQSVQPWQDGDGSPLDRLIVIYLGNHSSTRDADSVEKSRLNVAVGYLAILLGYICLSGPSRQYFERKNPKDGLDCLRKSIQEFVILHKTVDNRTDTADQVGRLQQLLDDMERV